MGAQPLYSRSDKRSVAETLVFIGVHWWSLVVINGIIRPSHCWLGFRVYVKCRANANDNNNKEDLAKSRISELTSIQHMAAASSPARRGSAPTCCNLCCTCSNQDSNTNTYFKAQAPRYRLCNYFNIVKKTVDPPPCFEYLGCNFFNRLFLFFPLRQKFTK